jgi:single-strand DNA-binding protein
MAFDNPYLIITGNTTGAPELRFTQAGKAVCGFTLAHTRRTKDANGTWQDGDTLFIRVNAWGYLAEHVAESFGDTKSVRLTVRGELYARNWTDKDGNDRVSIEMTADDVAASAQYHTMTVKKAARSSNGAPDPVDPWSGEVASERNRPSGFTEEPSF